MPTPPRSRPTDAGSTPGVGPARGGSPVGPGARGPASTRPGARAVRPPRKAQKIKWSPQAIEESHAGRWILTGFVGLMLIIGGIGWYWYLTRPEAAPSRVRSAAESASSTVAARPEGGVPASGPGTGDPRGSRAVTPSSLPITMTAKELREALLSHAPQPVDHAYAQYYQGREVTWAGQVADAQWQNRLLRVDLRDDDGLRVVAWCEGGEEPKPGSRTTVRGRVTTKLADGFVVERCEVL
jgi:hypothetical protein